MPDTTVDTDEVPHARPAGEFKRPFSAFAHLSTDYLHRALKDLRTHIPGDATWQATVSTLLQSLLRHDIVHPDRVAQDADEQRKREEAAAAEKAATDSKEPAEATG